MRRIYFFKEKVLIFLPSLGIGAAVPGSWEYLPLAEPRVTRQRGARVLPLYGEQF